MIFPPSSGEIDFVYRRISRLAVFIYGGAENYDDSRSEYGQGKYFSVIFGEDRNVIPEMSFRRLIIIKDVFLSFV